MPQEIREKRMDAGCFFGIGPHAVRPAFSGASPSKDRSWSRAIGCHLTAATDCLRLMVFLTQRVWFWKNDRERSDPEHLNDSAGTCWQGAYHRTAIYSICYGFLNRGRHDGLYMAKITTNPKALT